MATRDCSEEERRRLVRRPRFRFSRGTRIKERPQDRKRWAWQDRVWRTYGLAAHDIALQWDHQYGCCPICGGELAQKKWVIDHKHVKGFRKLPVHEKRRHFRGILCSYCNRYAVGGCERAGEQRTRNVVRYLKWSH